MKPILAPHKEQDGWVYWRIRTTPAASAANAQAVNPLWLVKKDTLECVKASDLALAVGYSDDTASSRIISSRRVEKAVYQADRAKESGFTLKAAVNLYRWLKERGTDIKEAVETADFLKLCAEEALDAVYRSYGGWFVVSNVRHTGYIPSDATIPSGYGTTLREAYYRYHAAAGDAE